MSSLLVENVGMLVTGRLDAPIADASSMYIEDSVIREVGVTTTTADEVVNAEGLTVTPGLINSHVHPTFGDYTRGNTRSGGVRAICAGESRR